MIYVDPLLNHGFRYKGNLMPTCHMWGDTDDELHSFAQKIGIKRSWCHNSRNFAHYDLAPGKRNIAVKNGAIELSMPEAVKNWRKKADEVRR